MLKKKESITLISSIQSIMDTMIADDRDWSKDDTDAWIYGVLWGWDDDSYAELQEYHRWTDQEVLLNGVLHQQIVDLFEENGVKP